jgi:hypothetical protein
VRRVILGALACIALSASVTESLASHTPAVTAFHQGPCEEQFVALPIPMAEAQALTPAGFPPKPWDTGGLSPPVPALATGVTVGYRCAATLGQGLALGEVRTIGRALLVDPPAHLRAPHIQNYVIVLGGWTSSAALAAVYQGWHLPNVEVGAVDFSWTTTANARVGQVTGSSAAGGLGITTVSAGVEEAQQADVFRLFVFSAGAVAGYIDWAWPEGARTIESGLALQRLEAPGAAPDLRAGASFHYFGAYEYNLAYTPLG